MRTVTNRESASAPRGWRRPPLRFVTVASLFDGHDAAINVMRRLIQDSGAEVVHLGHNRSVARRRARGDPGGRRRDRDQLLPGRPHRVLQVRGRHARASAAPGTSACSAAAAARSRRRRSRSCRRTASSGSTTPTTA